MEHRNTNRQKHKNLKNSKMLKCHCYKACVYFGITRIGINNLTCQSSKHKCNLSNNTIHITPLVILDFFVLETLSFSLLLSTSLNLKNSLGGPPIFIRVLSNSSRHRKENHSHTHTHTQHFKETVKNELKHSYFQGTSLVIKPQKMRQRNTGSL